MLQQFQVSKIPGVGYPKSIAVKMNSSDLAKTEMSTFARKISNPDEDKEVAFGEQNVICM